MIRAQRLDAELGRALLGHEHERGRAVVQRAGVAGRDLAVVAEDRRELLQLLVGGGGTRPVVGVDDRSVRARVRRQLAREMTGGLRSDGALLRLLGEAIHVLARDVELVGDVLRGHPHRDVDVRDRALAHQLRVQLLGVLRIAVDLRDRLDAGGDIDVALARLDRVERHPRRLERGGAEAVDRRSRHAVRELREQRRAAGEVHPLLLLREAAADDHVDDVLRLELRHLRHRLADREGEQVVGALVDQRALAGAPDRGADGADDHGFGHVSLLR